MSILVWERSQWQWLLDILVGVVMQGGTWSCMLCEVESRRIEEFGVETCERNLAVAHLMTISSCTINACTEVRNTKDALLLSSEGREILRPLRRLVNACRNGTEADEHLHEHVNPEKDIQHRKAIVNALIRKLDVSFTQN
jgi:hypothetical protein